MHFLLRSYFASAFDSLNSRKIYSMKNSLILLLLLTGQISFAQYCGNSGPAQCTPSGTFITPGFYPVPSQLPSFVNGQASTTVLEFKNFNVVNFQGNFYTVNSLRIDSVGNLPAGLCWATNKVNNTFINQEQGCVRINGTPSGPAGEYKLKILVTVDVGVSLQVDAAAAGVNYYVRLIDSCSTAPAVDTLQIADFVGYNIPGCLYVSLGADQTACNGTNINLSSTITAGKAPFTYMWQSLSGDAVVCDTCASPSVLLTQNSSFAVSITDSTNAVATDTVNYSPIGSAINFAVVSAGADTFCIGGSVSLIAAYSDSVTYQWQWNTNDIVNANDTNFVALNTGLYTVFFTHANGCTATSNVISVVVNPLPVVTFQLPSDTVCVNASAFALSGENPTGGNFAGIGVSANMFTPATAGTGPRVLLYTFTDSNNCVNSAKDTILVEVCTGLEEITANDLLQLYPNPTNGSRVEVTVNSALAGSKMKVYDANGRLLKEIVLTNEKCALNISNMEAGVYMVKVENGAKIIQRKFVKE